MVEIVAQFLGILGVTPPTNMAEFIPYILTIIVSLVMVTLVFRLVLVCVKILCGGYRF